VSLLQSVAKSPDSSDALRKALDEEGVADNEQLQQSTSNAELLIKTPISSSSTFTKGTTPIDTDEGYVLTSTTTSPPVSSCSLGIDSSHPSPYEPSADEAEEYLSTFRSRMLRDFAFIHIPPEMTAHQMRQDRPFLFRAIAAVATPSTQQKLMRGREFKRILAQTTLIENQSSIDLLLGLLTYVAWSYDQFLNKSGTLSRLMLLAMSLVYDLRLNKPLPPDVHMIGPFGSGFEKCYGDASDDMDQRFLERQRAVLGCFILSSMCVLPPLLPQLPRLILYFTKLNTAAQLTKDLLEFRVTLRRLTPCGGRLGWRNVSARLVPIRSAPLMRRLCSKSVCS